MSKKFVRSVKNVTDIEQFSKNVLEENDIVSTEEGKVYIVTKTDFIEIGGSGVDIAELKSSVATLETDVSTNQSDVGTLKTDVSTNKSDIKKLKTDVSTNQSDVGTLKTDVSTNQSDVKKLKTDVSTNQSDVGTLKTDVSTLKDQATDFENRIKALETPTPEE